MQATDASRSGAGNPPSLSGSPVALVVEDEPLIEWMLTDVLEENGFLVVPVRTLKEARDVIGSHREIDVFLIDSGLPDGDGLTLIPEIRNRFPEARIAAATGRGDVCVEGVTLFVKPYDISEIAAFLTGKSVTNSGRGPVS